MSEGTQAAEFVTLTEAEKNAIHDGTGTYEELFAAVERVMADRLSRAWDDGYKTGFSYRGPHGMGAGRPVPANPYGEPHFPPGSHREDTPR